MSVSEPERHDLYQTLEEMVGKKRAEVFMKLLPPVGWGDVATRRDLDGAVASLHAANQQEHELIEARINAQIWRTALVVNIPSILAAVGLSFAATNLG